MPKGQLGKLEFDVDRRRLTKVGLLEQGEPGIIVHLGHNRKCEELEEA